MDADVVFVFFGFVYCGFHLGGGGGGGALFMCLYICFVFFFFVCVCVGYLLDYVVQYAVMWGQFMVGCSLCLCLDIVEILCSWMMVC